LQTLGAATLLEKLLLVENPLPVEGMQAQIDAESGTYELGAKTANTSAAKGPFDRIDLTSITSHPWQNRVRIRVHAEGLTEGEAPRQLQRGRLLHELLARIDTKEDIPRVVYEMILEGWISESEADGLQDEVEGLFANPQIASWFDPEWQALTEREILMPDGTLLRPDRVIVKNGQAKVIDYKTGEKHASHENQIRGYCKTLEQMGYTLVTAQLLYTTDIAVVTVS
jgi:ATP-dependent exoDNAse (exonuclease V) beta subunit